MPGTNSIFETRHSQPDDDLLDSGNNVSYGVFFLLGIPKNPGVYSETVSP